MLFVCCSLCFYFSCAVRDHHIVSTMANLTVLPFQDTGHELGIRDQVVQSTGSFAALSELANTLQNTSTVGRASTVSETKSISEVPSPDGTPFPAFPDQSQQISEYDGMLSSLQFSLGWLERQAGHIQVTFELEHEVGQSAGLLHGLIEDLLIGAKIEAQAKDPDSATGNLQDDQNRISVEYLGDRYKVDVCTRLYSRLEHILVEGGRTFFHKVGDRVLILAPKRIVDRYTRLKQEQNVEFYEVVFPEEGEEDGDFVNVMLHVSILTGVDVLAPEEFSWGLGDDTSAMSAARVILQIADSLESVSMEQGQGSAREEMSSARLQQEAYLELSAQINVAEQQPASLSERLLSERRSGAAPSPFSFQHIRNTGLGFVATGGGIASLEAGMSHMALITRAGLSFQSGAMHSEANAIVAEFTSRPAIFRQALQTGAEGTFSIHQRLVADILGGPGFSSYMAAGAGESAALNTVKAVPGIDTIDRFARGAVRGEIASMTHSRERIYPNVNSLNLIFWGGAFKISQDVLKSYQGGKELSPAEIGFCAAAAGRLTAFAATPLQVLAGHVKQREIPSSVAHALRNAAARTPTESLFTRALVQTHSAGRAATVVSLATVATDYLNEREHAHRA